MGGKAVAGVLAGVSLIVALIAGVIALSDYSQIQQLESQGMGGALVCAFRCADPTAPAWIAGIFLVVGLVCLFVCLATPGKKTP